MASVHDEEVIYVSESEEEPLFPQISELLPILRRRSSDEAFGSEGSQRVTRSKSQDTRYKTLGRDSNPREGESEFYYIDDIDPPSIEEAKMEDPHLVVYNAAKYYSNTDYIGQYLIRRGFPLIGPGSASLCFLLTKDYVIKVPLNIYDGKLAVKHEDERSRDLALYEKYPTCYARIRHLSMLTADEEGARQCARDSINRGDPIESFCSHNHVRIHKVWVSERCYGKVIRGDFDVSFLPSYDDNTKEKENTAIHAQMMAHMTKNNDDVKQFMFTRPKRIYIPILFEESCPYWGHVLIESEELSWLVAIDQH